MEGYDKLASLMGDHPELATFRRFASLNAKNLLYLQAELTYLESKLRRLAHEDHVSSDEQKKLYAGDWYFLMTSYEDDESEQWSVMLKAREKLKEYSACLKTWLMRGAHTDEALKLQKELMNTPSPLRKEVSFLQKWLKLDGMGELCLSGEDCTIWDSMPLTELISLRTSFVQDPLSTFFLERCIKWWHQIFGHRIKKPKDPENPYIAYDERTALHYAALIGTVVASLLPIASIVVLYFVSSIPVRLGLVAAFTLLFGFVLESCTGARLSEIFAATSAFAAVQVVYVGSANNFQQT